MSEVSKRMATIAFAPFASASSTIRCCTCWRLSTSALVIPFSSPPNIDFIPELRAEVARADGEAEHLLLDLLDLVAGDVVHGRDDHLLLLLLGGRLRGANRRPSGPTVVTF
jgi:hypothetical protein